MSLQPTNVLLKGFDSRSVFAFDDFFLCECDADFRTCERLEDASIVIVDVDVCSSHKEIQRIQNTRPEVGILALSLLQDNHRERHNSLLQYLKKPLNLESFQSTLCSMKKVILNQRIEKQRALLKDIDKTQVQGSGITVAVSNSTSKERKTTYRSNPNIDVEAAKFVGKNSDVDVNNPQALLRVIYAPKNRFQGALDKAVKRARKYHKPVEMVCLNTGVIIDLEKNAAFTAVGDSVLKPLCLMNVERADSIRKIKKNYTGERILALARKPGEGLIKWSLEAFVWKIALWSSRGCIPKETDLGRPVYLSEWPNFTKLVCFPHAMRIASLLIEKPTRLQDVAEQLRIPQRYVFGFFSAAKALEISDVSERRADHLFEPKYRNSSSDKRHFLSEFINYLGAKTHQEEKKRA
ncbi:MAG: hypothetical protein OQK51_20105 [Kangiellaceae bacterium]|nr:hypothetical protein [Kangiellaceae bacterium]